MNNTKKKRSFSRIKMVLVTVILITFIAIIQQMTVNFMGSNSRNELRMTDTEVGISYGFDMRANFYSPGSRNFFYSTRDGIQSINSSGELRWQDGFTIANPLMVGRGDMVAVGEPGGHRIYVFDQSGHSFTAILEHPIMFYTINASGYLSVIVRTDTGYDVSIFSTSGGDAAVFRSSINDPNMYPVSVDVSNCGTYVAIALWDVNTVAFSRVKFSYVRRVDSRGIWDGLFSWYDYQGEFIYRVQFTPDNKILVFTDRQILGFEAGEGSQGPKWSIPLYNQLDMLYVGDNIFAYVTGDPFLNQSEPIGVGNLHIYDFNGRKRGEHNLGRRATHMSIGFNTVLVGTDRIFHAINAQGIKLWEYSAIQDVSNMIFLDNTDTVLLAGGNRATVMRRIRTATEDSE